MHGTSRAARDEAVDQLLQHCRDTAAWLSPFTHALGASALPRRAHRSRSVPRRLCSAVSRAAVSTKRAMVCLGASQRERSCGTLSVWTVLSA